MLLQVDHVDATQIREKLNVLFGQELVGSQTEPMPLAGSPTVALVAVAVAFGRAHRANSLPWPGLGCGQRLSPRAHLHSALRSPARVMR